MVTIDPTLQLPPGLLVCTGEGFQVRFIASVCFVNSVFIVFMCVSLRAHKLMGQACEREGLLEKAIVHYNRYVLHVCVCVTKFNSLHKVE